MMYNLYSENMNDLLGCNEVIQFQKNSKFGDRLTALFEEGYKIRADKYNKESGNHKEVCELISKLIDSELPKIFKEELNLIIKEIEFNTSKPTGFVAIDYYTYFDVNAVLAVESALRGVTPITKDHYNNQMIERIAKVVSVAKNVDQYTGKLNYRKGWPIKLYLDIAMFFFLDLFSYGDSSINMSARMEPSESAAIVMHEAGHAVIFLERASIGMYVYKTIDDNVKKFNTKNVTLTDVKEFANGAVRPFIDTIKQAEPNAFNKTIVSLYDKIVALLEILQQKIDEVRTVDKSEVGEKLAPHWDNLRYIGTLARLFFIILMMIFNFKEILLIYWILKLSPEVSGLNSTKTSDVKFTGHNLYLLERAADEFVVRNGYGALLASGLYKLTNHILFRKPDLDIVRESSVISFLCRFILIGTDFSYGSFPYERMDLRTKRMMQSAISIFKNKDIPANIRDNYLNQLDSTMKILNKYGQKFYEDDTKITKLTAVLKSLISIDDWIRILTSGRLTQEYEKQFNLLEDLTNNLLYADAASLKKVIDDMKK